MKFTDLFYIAQKYLYSIILIKLIPFINGDKICLASTE